MVLGLVAMLVLPEPAIARSEAPPRPWRPRTARALAMVPVPGFPSMVQGDWAGAGLSAAVAVPLGALWAHAATRTARYEQEGIVVGIAGAYLTTVLTNQLTGMRSLARRNERLKATLSVHPGAPGRTTTVGLHVEL